MMTFTRGELLAARAVPPPPRTVPVSRRRVWSWAPIPHRLPVGPLFEWVEATTNRRIPLRGEGVDPLDGTLIRTAEVGELLGLSSRQVVRWLAPNHQGLTIRTADIMACRLGVHPASIWRHLWAQVER